LYPALIIPNIIGRQTTRSASRYESEPIEIKASITNPKDNSLYFPSDLKARLILLGTVPIGYKKRDSLSV
jgi:hypothetical protein